MGFLARLLIAFIVCCVLAAAAEAALKGRLPGDARPLSYQLELSIDPEDRGFSGRVRIEVLLARPTTRIVLHGVDLDVGRVTASHAGVVISGNYHELDGSGMAQLDWPQPLPAGKVTLDITYTASLRESAEGPFRGRVNGDWYVWTQLQPTDARRLLPCFDEPGFKTPFTVVVTAPQGSKVFANAPEVGVSPAKRAGMRVHRFAPTKPIPTYLLSIGVGPFDVHEQVIAPNAVRSWPLTFRIITPRRERADAGFALKETPNLLRLLEDYFGSPYPYRKLDFIASPLMSGGMENPGLVLYGDTVLLTGDAPTIEQQVRFGTIVTHELAHQWFGDLVTPDWWTDIWLNESFASWMGAKIADRWRPELDFAGRRLLDAFAAMHADSFAAGRPVRQPITDDSLISSTFDAITYQKGAQVVSMFEAYVGADMFRRAVRRYLGRFAHANATAEDFFEVLSQVSGRPRLTEAMRSFTDQRGVPLLHVETTNDAMKVSQSRYLPFGVRDDSRRSWAVPFCVGRAGTLVCALLDEPEAEFPKPARDVLVPNAGAAGYYRFTLDRAGWERLTAAAPALDEHDALVLADSLWADFMSGRSSFAQVVAAARSFSRHPNATVAVLLAERMKGLARRMFDPDEIAGYRRLVGELYSGRLEALGRELRTGRYASDPVARREERRVLTGIVALEARHPALRSELAERARAWLAGDDQALDPSFRGVALQVAVQDVGSAFIKELGSILRKSTDPVRRALASEGLSAARAGAQADGVVELLSSGVAKTGELNRILTGLAERPDTRDRALAFTEARFDVAMTMFPHIARTRLITLFDGYCAPTDADRIEALFRSRLDRLGGGTMVLDRTRETIDLCAAFKAHTRAQFRAALNPSEQSE